MLKTGWLSPTGEFVECGCYDHIATARKIAEGLHLPCCDAAKQRSIPADNALMRNGWAYVGISSFMCHEWRIGWVSRLTPEQRQFLRPYFEESDIPVNKITKIRWEAETI